ncbi:hypothetical protein HELRODRAFT_168925 [Helobdella robusta]|uniref:Uncharacterized protein n=1 Tax=Helobdella robusta TaxID=6412 RepID=T1F152_HELRO|nr:hypothetical protein HELRODRAFT_168925 [Helobdella robusta]ESO08995.1 hypothetical protein HELRODRAFT_168925 [Helobdella robusta]
MSQKIDAAKTLETRVNFGQTEKSSKSLQRKSNDEKSDGKNISNKRKSHINKKSAKSTVPEKSKVVPDEYLVLQYKALKYELEDEIDENKRIKKKEAEKLLKQKLALAKEKFKFEDNDDEITYVLCGLFTFKTPKNTKLPVSLAGERTASEERFLHVREIEKAKQKMLRKQREEYEADPIAVKTRIAEMQKAKKRQILNK